MMRITKGLTLTELLIAMTLGVVLMSLAAIAFSSLSRSARQAQQLAELQQNAQFVLSLFHNELSNIGFWGGRADPQFAVNFARPAAPAGDCAEPALDSGSFPQPAQSFVTLYAHVASGGRQLGCLPDPLVQTEILQLKRLLGQRASVADMRPNRFYLETEWQHSRFVDSNTPVLLDKYSYYPYQHLVFYLQQQRQNGELIPVLMRKRLSRNAAGAAVISTDSVLDGVERMHFEFGIDSDFDGQLNYMLSTEQMTGSLWQQTSGRIISLRYHLLLRARQEDKSYTNEQHYMLGPHEFIAPRDNYRRMLVSSSIYFQNTTL